MCEDLGVKVNSHGGTGLPNYGKYAVADLLYITEVSFYSQRPFVQMLLSGVFERHPRLQFVMTEMGCAWLPPMLERFDQLIKKINTTGATGELRYTDEHKLPQLASDYFRQNCWVGVSQPGPDDAGARDVIGIDQFMWGSDYPHDEGTWPYTREHLRQLFHDTDPGRAAATARRERGAALRLLARRARAARRGIRSDGGRAAAPAGRAARGAERGVAESGRRVTALTSGNGEILARGGGAVARLRACPNGADHFLVMSRAQFADVATRRRRSPVVPSRMRAVTRAAPARSKSAPPTRDRDAGYIGSVNTFRAAHGLRALKHAIPTSKTRRSCGRRTWPGQLRTRRERSPNICHSSLTSRITVHWTRLEENVGWSRRART